MVWKFFTVFASKAVSLIIEGRKDALGKVIHETDGRKWQHRETDECRFLSRGDECRCLLWETDELRWLRRGDELCKGMTKPMSEDLVAKVKDIYKKCKSNKGDTVLMMALDMGFMHMVWGFIECAEQTNTNLHTGQKGDECVQEFLWLYNKHNQSTAFDIAITKGHMVVARRLVNHAPGWCLRSQWIRRREALLELINHDPKFDGFIFDMLENVTSKPVHINGQGGELKIYNKGVERIVTREYLDNLGNCLLGSDASKNSILHLVSKIGNVACVKYILSKDCFKINHCNSDMETPVYVAAREGRVDILRFMIKLLKKEEQDIDSIVTRCIDKHNALHIAIQNHHVEVVFLLIKEIPQLANRLNESDESPLYHAAERGYFGVVELMLNKCKAISFQGPNGKTALHAAATSDSAECVEILLRTNRNLLNVKDERGWTPLHHAVYHNSSLAATKLLEVDFSIGYHELTSKDGINTSAIHLAATLGYCKTMKVLIDLCPGCSDFTDNKGRNILHTAVENKKNKAIKFIFQDKSLANLVNQKDNKGNSPMDLVVASDFNINAINDEELPPLDIISSYEERRRLIKTVTMDTSCIHDKTSPLSSKEKKSEAKEKDFVIVDSLVEVAALIATASFAAGFTMPGGLYSSDGFQKGTPFLLRKPAFQAFIVLNAIAFSFSCCSILSYIEILLYRNRYDQLWIDEQEHVDGKVENMYLLTIVGLVAMTIAFVTGVYVVLTPLPAFAITVSILTLAIRGIYHTITYEAAWGLSISVKENHL